MAPTATQAEIQLSRSEARTRFERFERFTDLPMAFLALLIVPALIVEDRAQNVYLREAASTLNWIVWLAFCAEYLTKLAAPNVVIEAKNAWFDLLIIVLSPPFRPGRAQGTPAESGREPPPPASIHARAAVAAIGLTEAGGALQHRQFLRHPLTFGDDRGVGAGASTSLSAQ
jgi:hypothetical protein